jgi:hypothetical protein
MVHEQVLGIHDVPETVVAACCDWMQERPDAERNR